MLIVWLMDADWGYIYIYLYEYDTPVAQTKNQQSCLATANSSLPDVLISPWRPHHALLPAQSRGKSAGAEWLTEWTIGQTSIYWCGVVQRVKKSQTTQETLTWNITLGVR